MASVGVGGEAGPLVLKLQLPPVWRRQIASMTVLSCAQALQLLLGVNDLWMEEGSIESRQKKEKKKKKEKETAI